MTGRRLSILILVLAGLIVAGFAGWTYFKNRLLRQVTAPVEDLLDQVHVDISAKGVELVQGANGTVAWRLFARRAGYDQHAKVATVESPQVTYFDAARNQTLTVSAPEGKVDQGEDIIRLGPGVSASYGNTTIEGGTLEYTGATRRITISGNVTIGFKDVTITAPVVMLDMDSHDVVASGDVTAQFLTGAFSDNKEVVP